MSAWDDPAFRAMLEEAGISVTVRTWFEGEADTSPEPDTSPQE